MRKDNCKPRRETFKFLDLVHLILEILRYFTGKASEVTLEWVSEWLSLMAFLGTADTGVHMVHTSHVILAYTLESLSSLT